MFLQLLEVFGSSFREASLFGVKDLVPWAPLVFGKNVRHLNLKRFAKVSLVIRVLTYPKLPRLFPLVIVEKSSVS